MKTNIDTINAFVEYEMKMRPILTSSLLKDKN